MTAELRALLAKVAPVEALEIIAMLTTRVAAEWPTGNGRPPAESTAVPSSGDSLLTRKQAATKLAVAPSWLSRRKGRLAFEVRLGDRTPRYSSLGIDKFISQRKRGS